ncbi:hypothetical protein GLYMA_05G234400v4 [Glycine max]|uniref:F-box domain-containing protein n=1 Tax=Glycine max TaxID=3847 RepID=A0A0R0K5Q4_SOYBN|nr:F-box/FBD/LRR-repeat protein At1g78750 [Glycine max]KAG5041706.1 hypothetical protein JHK85_014182 [Glycine max]KRH60344.1 hypothetical protein GLYMA_05G234400v4 [Glycine max]|eukprot:XP_006580890.1 F-box/FBD/LRR-repeat protein At1g78750-like [Glycine max]
MEKEMINAKRQMVSGKDGEDYERERLSDLPECILLHIMKFMNTRHAVQTCVLSKRWKDLWKRLTSFSMSYYNGRIHSYNNFLSRFLFCRDDSISLLNLDFIVFRSTARSKLLKNILEHAASHNIQQLTITTDFTLTKIPNSFVPLIFGCHSLKFLELFMSSGSTLNLPKSLLLPSLKSLHLTNVSFAASDNGCTEPFSNCKSLNTLVLQHSIHHDAQVFCISNSNLSTLKLVNIVNPTFQPKIVLSTPNLVSVTIDVSVFLSCYELASTCDLPFLEEVNIDTGALIDSSVIISWLQVLSNVKILTLSSHIKDLSSLTATKIQPPCFVRLESLKMKKVLPWNMISDDEVKTITEYLLQNSPLTCRVGVIKC